MPKFANACACSPLRRRGRMPMMPLMIASMLISMFTAWLSAATVTCTVGAHEAVVQCTAGAQQSREREVIISKQLDS